MEAFSSAKTEDDFMSSTSSSDDGDLDDLLAGL
ncbi:hypothetical protein [Escherichia phage vB_EcoP_EP32B]|nr:hypothetical protein [Escherichia phage vB_EcoP_EP32B]